VVIDDFAEALLFFNIAKMLLLSASGGKPYIYVNVASLILVLSSLVPNIR
jgi:hypothetical protein